METTAAYYNGNTAGSVQVPVSLQGSRLGYVVNGQDLWVDLGVTTMRPPIARGAWVIELGGGAELHIDDERITSRLASQRSGFIERLEGAWHWALISALVAITSTWALLTWGVPIAAKQVAFALPEDISSRMREEGLGIMDELFFSESRLDEEDRSHVTTLFKKIQSTHPKFESYQLEFRYSEIGPNAFAVPGGFVVMTDQLIELAENEDQLVAVLAHEVGHLYGRHSLRILLQNSTTAVLIAAFTGDLSSITALSAAIPTILMQAKYSRDFEREADEFAFDYLDANGYSDEALSKLLLLLEDSVGKDDSEVPGRFSSHPPSRERVDKD
ncbi:MAG: M48 family metallopeptidase [Woeseiaceae bacterium]|nr:M48 family metallopeptidase [Woeseiaceae bacterium]